MPPQDSHSSLLPNLLFFGFLVNTYTHRPRVRPQELRPKNVHHSYAFKGCMFAIHPHIWDLQLATRARSLAHSSVDPLLYKGR